MYRNKKGIFNNTLRQTCTVNFKKNLTTFSLQAFVYSPGTYIYKKGFKEKFTFIKSKNDVIFVYDN